MSWLTFLVPVAIAVIVALLPGLAVLAPTRAPWLAKAALAGPISLAIIGAAGVFAALLHISFGLIPVAATTVLLTLGIWTLERFHRPSARPSQWMRASGRRLTTAWPTIAAWAAASIVIALVTFALVASPELFPQTYDNIFHINGTIWILQTGDASSLHFRQIIEPARASSYPAAWSAFAALIASVTRWLGVANPNTNAVLVPVALNAAWIATASVIWLPGIAWLTRLLIPVAPGRTRRTRHAAARAATSDSPDTDAAVRASTPASTRRADSLGRLQGWVVPLALLLGAGFAAMPYSLLSYGSLSPMFLSYAVTPVVVALVVVAARRILPRVTPGAGTDLPADRLPSIHTTTLFVLLALAAAAIAFAQPRAIVSAALIVGLLALAIVLRAVRIGFAAGPGTRARRRTIIATASTIGGILVLAAAAWIVVYKVFHVAERPISDHLNGPQATATQSMWDSLVQILAQTPPLGVGSNPIPTIAVAVAVLAGIGLAFASRNLRWVGAVAVASIVLYVLAAGSNSDFAKLATGLWYKDKFRLSSLVVITAIPLSVYAITSFGVGVRRWMDARAARRVTPAPRWSPRVITATAAVLVIASAWISVASAVPQAMGQVFARPTADKEATATLVDQEQVDFLSSLPDYIPEGQLVLGDPWDGSSMSWLYGDRQPVFPHVNGTWDDDRMVLLTSLSDIRTDPAVCAALNRLNVHYVLYNPHEFEGGDPAGNVFGSIHRAVEAGVFTDIVAQSGENVLYRIDQCD